MLKLQVNIININSVQWKSSESTRVSTYPVVSWCSVNSSLWRHVWNSARQLLPVFQVTTIHGFTSVISIPTWPPAIHSARTNSSFISAKYRAVSHHFPLISVRCVPCDATQSAVLLYGKSSVRLSVTLRYRDRMDWNSSKIISPLISLGCSLFADPNITDLFQGEHPEILAGIGEGIEKSAFGVQKL